MARALDFFVDCATLFAGLLAALIAAACWWGDRRRLRRRNPDRVGIMPWTGLFFWSVLAAAILLTASVEQWLQR